MNDLLRSFHLHVRVREGKHPRRCLQPKVYIYGPLNYNPVERYFFDRVSRGRPVPALHSSLGFMFAVTLVYTSSVGKVGKGGIYGV